MTVRQDVSVVTDALSGKLEDAGFVLEPGVSDELVDVLAESGALAIQRRLFFEMAGHRSKERWTKVVGPFFDTERVCRLLGVSRQAVHKNRGILVLKTGLGTLAYPTFQFQGGKVLPGLRDVLAVLPEGVVSRWSVAAWLITPDPEFDGRTPVDLLAEGQVVVVVGAARRWAAALAA